MKYQVFADGKPADCYNHKVHESWNKSIYDTFEEAIDYAELWQHPYGGNLKEVLKVNVPFEWYEGCFIEIREV